MLETTLKNNYAFNNVTVKCHWNLAQWRKSILHQARIHVLVQGWKEVVDNVGDYIEK